MPQPYGTDANPILFNVPGFGGKVNFYSLRRRSATILGAQFGHGKNGTPAKGEVSWSDPDKFNSIYSYSDYRKADKVDGYDFVDPDNNKVVKGRFIDGREIPGKTVWLSQQAAKSDAEAIYEDEKDEGAVVSGAEFHPVK